MWIRYNITDDIWEFSDDDGDNFDPLPISQIPFPATQNPSTDANTLDDYQEGTWVGVIGGSGGESGQTYGTVVCTYIKVGKKVTAWFDITLTAKGTITTSVQIKGLPFTSDATGFDGNISFWSNMASNFVFLSLVMAASGTAATLFGATAAAAGLTSLTTADINNNTRLVGRVEYMASA